MDGYFSISGECVTQKIIEKSRFVTTSRRVEGEQAAKLFVSEMRDRYPDATHNCYAYVCDKYGNFMRFSDDNEPQGTAGMPILEVIKNKKLFETAVVVTRYFGGIKLGAGGLTRAYSGCAAENLDLAEKVFYTLCCESKYTVDYSSAEAASRFFAEKKSEVLGTEYSDAVIYTVAVKKDEAEAFDRAFFDLLNGKVKIYRQKEYYFPFKL